ncbi:uncharacterized protein LOC123549316 [Mercenaria mercenaria]|uniref:uncharacterized protein LOC123549316 n=1 Tax=Mercenaria mercenaria TaxID=6596 RepID=UPI001E1DC028|nr:uncharacterized protein LOC123549316 [Mercenaria mercenaria]XP_045193249.1 uncharacterized protein LOC123549316 [Mercenaria mercenaria]
MSSCRKKRRRSSLASSRIRVSLSPGLGLHRQVEQSLSPEERLQELSSLCLKFAVDKACKEAESLEVRDHLENVKEEILKVVDSKEHKEAVHFACHQPDKLLPNPANVDMDETIEMMERRINSLHKEEQDWHEYFAELDRQTQEAESKTQNLTLLPSDLSEEQKLLAKGYLPDLADLSLVKQQTDTAVNKIFMLVCEHEKNLHTQQQLLMKVNKQLDVALKKLHEKTFPNMGSPRATVQHLSEFPTPPAEPLG